MGDTKRIENYRDDEHVVRKDEYPDGSPCWLCKWCGQALSVRREGPDVTAYYREARCVPEEAR